MTSNSFVPSSSMTSLEMWEKVRSSLNREFGDAIFKSWLNPLGLKEVVGHKVILTAPTRFMRDWVLTHYGKRLQELWAG